MAVDYDARLTKVSTAIEAILDGGQDVTYNGNRISYADLEALQKEERRLEAKVKRNGKGIRMRRGTPT